jgi:hypothetical protein
MHYSQAHPVACSLEFKGLISPGIYQLRQIWQIAIEILEVPSVRYHSQKQKALQIFLSQRDAHFLCPQKAQQERRIYKNYTHIIIMK